MSKLHALGSATLSSFLVASRNRLDDEVGRPYSMRTSAAAYENRHERCVRHGLQFGPWLIGSKQRRLGDANDYRRNIFEDPEIFTGRSLEDLLRYLKTTLRDVLIPHAVCQTDNVQFLASIIIKIHNMNYLTSTIVVLPRVTPELISEINTQMKTYDYSAEPTANALSGIFRKYVPQMSSTLDLADNTINLVDYDIMSKALIDEDTAYHFRAVVLFVNANNLLIGEAFKQGAKYISSQVLFVDNCKSISRTRQHDDEE